MKILKQGTLPKSDTLIGTCKHCGCEVETLKQHLEAHCYASEASDGSKLKWWVKCPTCQEAISVQAAE